MVFLVVAMLMVAGIIFWKKELQPIRLEPTRFSDIPGWESANVLHSLLAFKKSCTVFLHLNPEREVGSAFIPLKAKDWQPACRAALTLDKPSLKQAKLFFTTWFEPKAFYDGKPIEGLFTGYYMPVIEGSQEKTAKYKIPLYGLPNNLLTIDLEAFDADLKNKRVIGRVKNNTVVPYYTREAIVKGAIEQNAAVVAWIESPIDRLFLEIQGSGVIMLPDKQKLYIGYAAQNGAPYRAIASVLIEKGEMTKDNASMQGIKKYLEAHPSEISDVLNQNASFVFFKKQAMQGAVGSQGVVLTPGYSLAVDLKWVPIGTPIWLDATHPDEAGESKNILQRLMIAQDTGGAIRGAVRGDVYWGDGKKAEAIAGRMRDKGEYWLLLPKSSK